MRPLIAIGNVNVDLIIGPATPWPKHGTEIIVDHDELRVGGCAGNNALAWNALGVDYAVAANIGNDQFGQWLKDGVGEKANKWPISESRTTLSVGITHPDGERTFFTTRGHLASFSFEDVKTSLDGDVIDSAYALLSGGFLTDTLAQDYSSLFDWTDAHNMSVALDTGWPVDGWTEANKTRVFAWLKRCKIALFNEVETITLTGIDDLQMAASALKSKMPVDALVVVKCGSEGALAIGSAGDIYSVAAPRVDVIDTIGAGDVFNAAFLAALAQQLPLPTCLEVGVKVASLAVSTNPRSYGEKLSTIIQELKP